MPFSQPEHYSRVEAILSGSLYFSSPVSFNDPFEISPVFGGPSKMDFDNLITTMFGQELSHSARTKVFDKFSRSVGSNHKPAISREWLSEIGVHCLSTTYNDILMRSHYAEKHSGICIGFDSGVEPFCSAREVHYSDERPRVSVLHSALNTEQLIRDVLFRKSKHWQYEREWRIVKRPIKPDELNYYKSLYLSEPSKEDQIAQLLANEGGVGFYEFDPSAIRKIYVGACANSGSLTRLSQLLSEKNMSIKVLQMKLDPGYFALREEKLYG